MNLKFSSKETLTNFDSLASTIEVDDFVFHWFASFINNPNVKNDLKHSEIVKKNYARLKGRITIQILLFFAILFLICHVLLNQSYIFILLGIGIYLLYRFNKEKIKKDVKTISLYIVKNHFTEETIAEKTLYQIGEFFAKKYNTESMVLSITNTDHTLRNFVLFIFLFGSCIYPFESWVTFILIMIGCFLVVSTREFQKYFHMLT